MQLRIATLCVLLILSGSLSGCGRQWATNRQLARPRPPTLVNAALPGDNVFFRQDAYQVADTVVVARIEASQEYARKVQGDWEWHWSVITAKVLRIEKGTWPEGDLRFIVAQIWPTRESGIMLKMAPFPFRTGLVYVFGLDTSVKPARVLRYDARSPGPDSQP